MGVLNLYCGRFWPKFKEFWKVVLPNTINAGQSFSVASGFAVGSVAVVLGSMGAGGVGGSISYQELANFSVNVAPILFSRLT